MSGISLFLKLTCSLISDQIYSSCRTGTGKCNIISIEFNVMICSFNKEMGSPNGNIINFHRGLVQL